MLKALVQSKAARSWSAAYSTKGRRRPRNAVPRSLPRANLPKKPDDTTSSANSSVEGVSNVLRELPAEDNNLLSPIHVPEDPYAVIKENHPVTSILRNSSIVVQRQLEWMNVTLGFEQANKYVIMDGQGNHIGFMAEQESGMRNVIARQTFRTHRSFTAHIFDKYQKEVLRFHRPFAWINSNIRVYDPLDVAVPSYSSSKAVQTIEPGSLSSKIDYSSAQISHLALSDMRVIGEVQQIWAPLRRKYNLFLYRDVSESVSTGDPGHARLSSGDLPLSNSQQLVVSGAESETGEFAQFAYVDEPFASWDFSLKSADSRLIGSVNRNFQGFGRELFTDTGVYALRMDAASIADESQNMISETDRRREVDYESKATGMTLDQRAVMLATAVSVDFDYFSRRRSGPMGMLPLWIPYGGEAAEGGAAAGEGAAEGGEGALGKYGGDDASPTTDQASSGVSAPGQGEGNFPPENELWGETSDPWGGDSRGGSAPGGETPSGPSGGGGGEGGGFDIGDWF